MKNYSSEAVGKRLQTVLIDLIEDEAKKNEKDRNYEIIPALADELIKLLTKYPC